LRFAHLTGGHYPHHITIVSHAFKRRRFLELHVPAIQWGVGRVSFVGVDPPEEVTPRRVLEEGEAREGWGRWVEDLYGVGDGEGLGGKRVRRGWGGRYSGVVVGEGVRGLLEWGWGGTGREVFMGGLPWGGE